MEKKLRTIVANDEVEVKKVETWGGDCEPIRL